MNLDVVIRFLQQGNVNGAIAELNKFKSAASDAGEKGADQFTARFEHKLKLGLANIAGRFAGIPGVGGLIAGFGIAGAGAAVGFGLLEKAIDAVIEKHNKLKEETAALVEVHKQLRDVGVDEKLIVPMTKHVEQLAKALGTDLKGAAAVARAELAGDFTELKKLGIVINEDIPLTAQLQQAISRLGTLGKRDLFGLENAAKLAAGQIDAIKTSAENATGALQKNLAAVERNHAAFARSTGDTEGADIAEIEAQVAEGGLSRTDADKRIADLKQRNLATRHEAFTKTGTAKIGALGEAITGEREGMIAGGEDIAERERIVELAGRLRQQQSVTSNLEGQTKSVVESGFGKGKTEAEYRAYLATIPAGVAAEKLGQLDRLAQQTAQSQAAERELREQLPAGRTDVDAETASLNKLRPEVVASQNAAYKRIISYMEQIAELEQALRDQQHTFEEQLRQGKAEARGKNSINERSDRERLQKSADQWLRDYRKNPNAPMPEELRGVPGIENIEFDMGTGRATLPGPRGGTGALNVNVNSGAAVAAANELGRASQAGFDEVAHALKTHAREIDNLRKLIASSAVAVYAYAG